MKGNILRRGFRYLRRVVFGSQPKKAKTAVVKKAAVKKAVVKGAVVKVAKKGVLSVMEQHKNWEFLDPPVENIFYFSGRVKDIYQLEMWIQPFFDCGIPFYVCARELPVFLHLQARGIKAILVLNFEELGVLSERGSKNIFYVNNSAKNTHMIRYADMMHIQLLHGDSDKPPSYNPVSQMYDLIFVAGEGAIQRYYSNGVFVPPEKFVICSRPQLKQLDLPNDDRPQQLDLPNDDRPRLVNTSKVVLFCTTWGGHQKSSNYSTLNIIYEAILGALSEGLSVIFRPHPLSCQDKEDKNFINKIAYMLEDYNYKTDQFGRYSNPLRDEDDFDDYYFVMNYADFYVGDLASTVHDWVYLKKPFIIAKSDFIVDETYRNSSLYKYGQFSLWEKTMSIVKLLKFETDTFDEQLASKRRTKLLGVEEGENAADVFRRSLRSAIKPDSKRLYIEGLLSKIKKP